MENRVSLYNSYDIKIGETFTRRARQLVRQQRAMWTDDSQTAIRFAPGMENMDTTAEDLHEFEDGLAPNQLCFAPWHDNYYYPAVISDVHPNLVKLAFLDGYTGSVAPGQVLSLQEGFDALHFECKYSWMGFYKGAVISQEPIVFQYYEDGIMEQTELRRLRGLR